ncbi:hypothetical protein CIL05_11220 [Virgibacillus profundi]|uniref:HTH lysR-type domain-containing protein n=2 Tax=Virgibacillus profundi TaxID=2024555 RepID=A0A2A2IE63_9BACI|nr:hypothetical protein CIL05_11220 [Virgibacillus profundi]PXY53599.1 LysR family transcriptional regulator [Virgibacillus profundi]
MAAEYENFRIVAEKLFVSQPAITFQIKQLEKELGVKLFSKIGRNIYLTEFGRLFYQEAKQMISQYDKSIETVNQYKQGYNKTIRIAISPMYADTILPSILHKYTKHFPDVELSIQVLESAEISPLIKNGEFDIGLSCLPGLTNVKTVKFHTEPVSLVCKHDGYDAESGPIIDALELLENNIVFSDNHPAYWDSLKELLKYKLPSLKFMKVNQTYATKRFVLEGIGVSFLPKSIINRELLEGRLMEVSVPFIEIPTASMYIIYKFEHQLESDFVSFISNYHYS